MDQYREDPQGDPLAEPALPADQVPEPAAATGETLRLGDPDPAATPTAPHATAADPVASTSPAGSGASALGGSDEPASPTGSGAGETPEPGAVWTGAGTGDPGPVAGQGGAAGAAEAAWGGPTRPGGPGGPGGAGSSEGPGGAGPEGPGGPGGGLGSEPPRAAGPGGFGGGGTGVGGSFRRLTRQREGRVVAGVAGGLARYLNVDPVILRIAFVGLTLLGFLGVVLYLLAWLMIPERAGVDSPGESLARRLAGAPPWVRVTLLVVGTLIALEAVGPLSTILIVGLLIGLGVAASNTRGSNGAGAAADRS